LEWRSRIRRLACQQLRLGELALVQPNLAITGNTEETKTCDYTLLTRHKDFISLQQINRLNIDAVTRTAAPGKYSFPVSFA
jgi:hypothetical protein